jgi:signal transduction histidine kinase
VRRIAGPAARLSSWSMSMQVAAAMAIVPLLASLVAVVVVPIAVRVSLGTGAEPELVAQASHAAIATMLAGLAVAMCAAIGAGTLLARSVGALIERMRAATDAIAGGDTRVRIGSTRGDELGVLAGSIDDLAERLAELEAARRDLLASVSHELRTPLTVIRGHLFTLARGASDERQRQRIELVDGEADRLAVLVQDLLDAATLHAGGLSVQRARMDLGEIAAAAADRFVPVARDAGCRLQLQTGPPRDARTCRIDPARMHQVLGNLIGNAIRHAATGSTIEVVLAAPVHGRCELSVSNSGDAIPAELRASLFEPFVRGSDAGRGRLGLGLAIARDLTRAMGGELRLADDRDRTRFVISMPTVEPTRATRTSGEPHLPDAVAAAARRSGQLAAQAGGRIAGGHR